MFERITLNRKELYEKVWSEPMSRLSHRYCLSDVGLSKICNKLNVPVPGRGYWARVQSGQHVKNTPLPKAKPYDPNNYTFRLNKFSNEKTKFSQEANELIAQQSIYDAITVSERLDSLHHLVRETKDLLIKQEPHHEYGVISTRDNKCLEVRIEPSNLNRGMRILNALTKFFEERGFPVSIDIRKDDKAFVKILGEKVHFSLHEIVKRSDHIPTEDERKELKQYRWTRLKKWDYMPQGLLILQINEFNADYTRKKWKETKLKPLETMLDDFIIGAIKVADLLRQHRIEWEEKERKWEEERRKKEEEQERIRLEEMKIRDLEAQAISWTKSIQLRNYIQAVENKFSKQQLSKNLKVQLDQWLIWANQHADKLDPLNGNSPFEKD